jgi:hypothetical protein
MKEVSANAHHGGDAEILSAQTPDPGPSRERGHRCGFGLYTKLAFIAWAAASLVLIIRLLHLTHRATTFGVYFAAGQRWRNGEPVYASHNGMGFVYSPLCAAYFAAYSFFPMWIGGIVWLLTNIGLLVGGTYAVMRESVFNIASDRARALVLILMLPLSLPSLDVAQSNAAMIGLLLLAIAMAMRERWTLCVIAICAASYLKIYPVVLGLVLCLYQPGKVAWRLAFALLAFGILSFFLQNPHYVFAQYHDWIATRGADDRRLYSMTHAPLDLWFLIVRLGHLPLSEGAYMGLQVLSGAAIGAFCLLSSPWPPERRLAGILLLCCCWIILLGPATESYTFAILAPLVGLGIVAAFSGRASPMARALVGLSMALLISAQLKSSFFSQWRSNSFNGLRPAAALLLLGFVILWLRNDAMWNADKQGDEAA